MYKIVLLLIILPFSLIAQTATERDLEIAEKFVYRSHEFNDITLPYRLFIPENYDSTVSYPLVLTMHGSGERGTDNNRQILDHRVATSWADSINQEKYPCFVISPQVPTSGSWVDFYNVEIDRVPASPYLLAANDAVTSIINEFNIDTTRLYATGLSMGGYGTWDLILRFPDRYACAIPMSGGSDMITLGNSLHTPIWNFHGRQDAAVSIDESTRLFDRFNSFGRETMYTHCSSSNCTGLTEQEIQDNLNQGNDLVHTEYEFGGHVIWADSYDYPLLFPWVFKQYFVKDAVTITSINDREVISGQHNLEWQTDSTNGTVDIYYSKNFGTDWESVAQGAPANTPYLWDSGLFDDAPFVTLKVILRDDNFTAFTYTNSEVFTVDNEGNGIPYVGIKNKSDFDYTVIESDEVIIEYLAGDPEWENMNLAVYYSSDDGNSFEQIHAENIASSREIQNINVVVSHLQNSRKALLKLAVSDGEHTASDYTYRFTKETGRNTVNEILSLEKANFDVPFDLVEVNPSERNDHRYIITFDDTSSKSETYYSIFDQTSMVYIAEQNTVRTNSESILFGGLSFKTSGKKTSVDAEQTGWSDSSSQQSTYTITPFFVNDSYPEYDGYAAPYDYRIEYFDEIVGSSTPDTLANLTPPVIFPGVDVDFKVKNITNDEYVDFVNFSSGSLVKTSTIYFVEDINEKRTRTWRTVIYSTQDDFAKYGDTLFINTYKGLSVFDTVIVDPNIVSVEENNYPIAFVLQQNYPNPFNPTTTIKYSLPVNSKQYVVGSRKKTNNGKQKLDNIINNQSLKQPINQSTIAGLVLVKLVVYDILGREVETLVNELKSPGSYRVTWDAAGFSSGVYFYRLSTGGYSNVKKMLLLR